MGEVAAIFAGFTHFGAAVATLVVRNFIRTTSKFGMFLDFGHLGHPGKPDKRYRGWMNKCGLEYELEYAYEIPFQYDVESGF